MLLPLALDGIKALGRCNGPMYHGNVSTFGFADAHAESHSWHDSALIRAGLDAAKGNTHSAATSPGVDYEYLYNGYRFPGWQQ